MLELFQNKMRPPNANGTLNYNGKPSEFIHLVVPSAALCPALPPLAPPSHCQHSNIHPTSFILSVRALYSSGIGAVTSDLHFPFRKKNTEPALQLKVGLAILCESTVMDVPPCNGLDFDRGSGHEVLAHFFENVKCPTT
mmetsp:Transcript_15195/g.32977  ORF Transcript_15195/g.32977 Transcript_15195/m.32977 type:complete len:139 (+) Transcript_15195:2112-2528(+)